jgi:hypothetical protein
VPFHLRIEEQPIQKYLAASRVAVLRRMGERHSLLQFRLAFRVGAVR